MQSFQEVLSSSNSEIIKSEAEHTGDHDDDLPAPDEIIQTKVSAKLRDLREFLFNGQFVAEKGDPDVNVQNSAEKRGYVIPAHELGEFFRLLEECRRENRMIHYGERQFTSSTTHSGIMLDFDHYQKNAGRDITPEHISKFVQKLARMMYSSLDCGTDRIRFRAFVIRKPAPRLQKVEKGGPAYYKDGFHILIPEIMVTKGYKLYLINELITRKVVESVFNGIEYFVPPGKQLSSALDTNSGSVPVNFYGCSKPENMAYPLEHVFEISSDEDFTDCEKLSVKDITSGTYNDMKLNLCYEMGLCYYTPALNGAPTWLKKKTYNARATIETIIQLRSEKSAGSVFSDEDIRREEEDVTLVNITNPRARYIMELLNILDIKYATEYKLWYRTICAIAHTGKTEDYKTVARAFSHRNPTSWNPSEFERVWNEAANGRYTGVPATRFSISKWARESSPEKFAEIEKRNSDRFIKQLVYMHDGKIEHASASRIVLLMCGDKYVVDDAVHPTTGRYGRCWWEFVTGKETMKKGEIFKWRAEPIPDNLHLFIGDKMPIIYETIKKEIKENKEKSSDEALAKWWVLVEKNFKKSYSDLGNNAYQNNVIHQCELRFRLRGFADALDSYEDIIGVGNGVLKIGPQPELITGFHDYRISKFTETDYVPFNPENPHIKRLLAAFRDIFIEPDVFEFMMFHAAVGLDAKEAACIFTMCVGGGRNGKTFYIKMVHNTLGNMYCSSGKPALLTDRNERGGDANSAQMQMKDKRYFYFDEFNKCELLNTARMKSIVNPGWQSGRDLYSKQTNFKTTCNAIAMSNFDFIVDTTDHGTWRRIYYYRNKVKFCEKPNPNNPYERKVDKKLLDECANSPEYKSAMLAIMVHYYSRLCVEYGGDLGRVPVPTIRRETAEFRNRQDALNKYLTQMIVSSPTAEPIGLTAIACKYNEWYKRNVRNVDQPIIEVQSQLENSIITKYIEKTFSGQYLRGHRIKAFPEEPLAEGEKYISDEALDEIYASMPQDLAPADMVSSADVSADVIADATNVASDGVVKLSPAELDEAQKALALICGS